MNKSFSSVTNKQLISNSLKYMLTGGLLIKTGYLPKHDHNVPDDFIGICVASNEDPETDAYIIAQLETLGIENVRLDFSYNDPDNFNARFLEKLIDHGFNITLRLFPPYNIAAHMTGPDEQSSWRQFLTSTLDQYGTRIKQVEVCNTINRKRWAGYSLNTFLLTWQIAYEEVKSRGITLLGPNIQDFEPIYNVGILKILQTENLLPDVHTDNLFVERVTEPERFDHRILKYQWSKIFKYNLIKKARILAKIGDYFGVNRTASSAAFWAIYRIERQLVAGAQKQADYLTRYFTLLAASGALIEVNWGAFICHREGLINDGLSDDEYPMLERIAHYKSADGILNEYARYPSFYAMQTLLKQLKGARYISPIATTKGLEIHHFTNADGQYHTAWTVNGKIASLADIYDQATLATAKIIDRDGSPIDETTWYISESPIYLCWETTFNIRHVAKPKLAKDLAIHQYSEDSHYYQMDQNGWSGLVLARDQDEATRLMQTLDPSKLSAPNKGESLRHARNVIWACEDPRDTAAQITIKQPVKMYPHKAFFDRFKPSKAKRSWNGAMELMRRGIGTAKPVAYFEKTGDKTLKENFYICEHVDADCSIGNIFSAFARGEDNFKGLTSETVYQQFARFSNNMHKRGIYFRDYSGGNILVTIAEDNKLAFSLIDTARLRTFNGSAPLKLRIADLTRACHKLHPDGRNRFMQIYLGLTGRKLTLPIKSKFWLYECKVMLKRTIGRKGMKKLVKRFKKP